MVALAALLANLAPRGAMGGAARAMFKKIHFESKLASGCNHYHLPKMVH